MSPLVLLLKTVRLLETLEYVKRSPKRSAIVMPRSPIFFQKKDDRDPDQDLNFHKDRDRDRGRDFGDRANALPFLY